MEKKFSCEDEEIFYKRVEEKNGRKNRINEQLQVGFNQALIRHGA